MKIEKRYIRFVNNVTTTMSDEQMTKINFIMKFCSWQYFDLKSSCHAKTTFEFENLKFLKFEFFKRPRMEKLPK